MQIDALTAASGYQNIINFSPAVMQKATESAGAVNVPAGNMQNNYNPGIIVEISQEAKNYAKAAESGGIIISSRTTTEGSYAQKLEEIQKTEGCQTCKNRKYVDDSSDSTVSYQSPAKIAPQEAAGKVMAHEQEHITNEKARAGQEDRRVVSSSVSIQTSICPECGRMYVSGGTARILTASDNKGENSESGAEVLSSKDSDQNS